MVGREGLIFINRRCRQPVKKRRVAMVNPRRTGIGECAKLVHWWGKITFNIQRRLRRRCRAQHKRANCYTNDFILYLPGILVLPHRAMNG